MKNLCVTLCLLCGTLCNFFGLSAQTTLTLENYIRIEKYKKVKIF